MVGLNMKDKIIEEIAKDICKNANTEMCANGTCPSQWSCPLDVNTIKILYEKGWIKPKDAVVLTNERKYILANKVYSDATLKGWKKEDLIEHIRILEHNWASAEEALNIQAKNCEMLLKQESNKTAKETLRKVKQLIDNVDIVVDNDIYSWNPDAGYDKKQVDCGLSEIAKQCGVDIKE